MPFIILGGERFALPIGETPVGGTGDDALPFPELAELPAVATLAVGPDGEAVIRRTARDHRVTVDGREIGDEPVPLAHGARLEVEGLRMTFGDVQEIGGTAHVGGVPDDALASLGSLASTPTADTGGRLLRPDGTTFPVPADGLAIGRDPECGLVLTGKGVSRTHAVVRATVQGYVLEDTSANGTLVNDMRVEGSRLLGMSDVVRIGEHVLTFEAPAPEVTVAPRVADPASPASAATAAARRAPELLGTLEIMNEGVLKGTRFRLERPAIHVGRGAHNEVRLEDKSVSGTHATLTRRAGGWYVLDLESTNGTYVNGERIRGERRLEGATELRFGGIKMVFRPIGGPAVDDASTRVVVGVRDEELA